jgi:SAM-dependent methyltransferase
VSGAESERYWDERARENALYFVDNEVDYDDPDTDAFWRRGQDVVDRMLDVVELSPGPDDLVLDIGCGVGRLTRVLAARTKRVYGLDVSGEMLRLAREHNADLANVEWLHGDGQGLGVVDDASVDGCFSHVVFQHIPDPAITLNYVREMGRVLRPGGWAVFQVSTNRELHREPEPYRVRTGLRIRIKGLLGRHPPADEERSHEVRSHEERSWWGSAVEVGALRAAAEEGGLEIERLLGERTQFTTVLARRAP